jgi:hypothetical protein
MKGSKPLAFLKIFGRAGLPECFHLTALLGTIFLVIFICASVTAGTVPERASITGNVSFQGKAVSKALMVAASLNSEKKNHVNKRRRILCHRPKPGHIPPYDRSSTICRRRRWLRMQTNGSEKWSKPNS